MTELLNILLTMLLNYGYPVVFMCILFAYLGLPIPTNAILLAAGAFSVDFYHYPEFGIFCFIGQDFFGQTMVHHTVLFFEHSHPETKIRPGADVEIWHFYAGHLHFDRIGKTVNEWFCL